MKRYIYTAISVLISKKMFLQVLCFSFLFCILGCEKFVDVSSPKNELISQTVFNSEESAEAAIAGIYSKMMQDYFSFSSGGVTLTCGLAADEFTDYSGGIELNELYHNSLSPSNGNVSLIWAQAYELIYYANSAIEKLEVSNSINENTKHQLTGEARFIRAFCYYYLVSLFGDVPLVISTNYRTNSVISRSTSASIYDLITDDLNIAKEFLGVGFSASNSERVKPNRAAAVALLAKVYLAIGNWEKAETESSEIINNTALYALETDLNAAFLKNSKEAIWQLKPVAPDINTFEGSAFIFSDYPTFIAINPLLLNSFEPGDQRKTDWLGSIVVGSDTFYYPYKYKASTSMDVTEYYTVLRLSDQYLTRAEARGQRGDILGASEDLNMVRNRAGLPSKTFSNKQLFLSEVLHERQVELFAEWGSRWIDVKRSHQADEIFGPIKGANWQSTDTLFPIPQSELLNDPNLSQNQGY